MRGSAPPSGADWEGRQLERLPESTAQNCIPRFGHARARAGDRRRKAPPGASLCRLRQHAVHQRASGQRECLRKSGLKRISLPRSSPRLGNSTDPCAPARGQYANSGFWQLKPPGISRPALVVTGPPLSHECASAQGAPGPLPPARQPQARRRTARPTGPGGRGSHGCSPTPPPYRRRQRTLSTLPVSGRSALAATAASIRAPIRAWTA